MTATQTVLDAIKNKLAQVLDDAETHGAAIGHYLAAGDDNTSARVRAAQHAITECATQERSYWIALDVIANLDN